MLKTFVSELRRRNVLPTIVPYIGLIWLLLQVVSVIQPMLNWSPLVSTFTAITLFAGFPVVLYLSWYFNFTLQGLEPIGDADSGAISEFGAFKWLILLVITFGSGSLGYLYFGEVKQQIVKREEGISQVISANSIAVLPFRDQSPDQDQAYITEGLTEELTALLGKSSSMKVAAASSTFALVEQNLTPMDIGRRLNVDTLVTGSLRVTGNKLKIRTELIESASGMTLWTQTFSREFEDIFAVEEEISRSIVNLLEDRYIEVGQVTNDAKTASTDAYVMYLKGREQYRKQTTESIKQARKYFEQAIALDPEYVTAFVALADTILLLEKGQSRFGILDTDIAISLADQQLSKALIREQNDARAYAIQGKLFELRQDFDAAISSLDKAISINPSLAVAYMWKFLIQKKVNQHSAALASISKAYELDPASISTIYNYGMELTFRGRFDEAKQVFDNLLTSYPQSPYGHAGLATYSFMRGELADTLIHWQHAMHLSPQNSAYESHYLNTLVTLRMAEQLDQDTDDPFYDASILIIENNIEQLFADLEFQIKAYPDDPWIKFELAWYKLLFAQPQRGIELLLQASNGFSEQDRFQMPMCSPAIEIAWALKQTDKEEESNAIIAKCKELSRLASENGLIDSFNDHLAARIAALEGDIDAVALHLNRAIEHGWREWWTQRDPILQGLPQTPEIQALFETIESDITKQRAKAKALLSRAATQKQQTKAQ
ncbi:tetratricopeptide repeat protein [Aliiglaciecola litoralis]|uniref:TolB amino-terminal domain-containing protein n=1 Tax=Aliiglaciecola litoralis TaxID=582857 RepID=A0ABN1LSQ3_9ALTE